MAEQDGIDTNGQFYYADGKKIPLAPSQQFIAVRADAHTSMASGDASRIVNSLSAVTTPAQVFELPEYNLAIVKVADISGARMAMPIPAETVRSFVNSQPELTLGPSVYEVAGTPTQEALIPIGEILVKFKPGVTEEAKRQLLNEDNLEVRQSDYPEPGAYLVAANNDQETLEIANKLHESDLVEAASPNFVRLAPRLASPDIQGGVLLPSDAALNSNGELLTITPSTTDLSREAKVSMPSPVAPPTDPGFISQWGLAKIKAPEAFDISMGSPAISIAIIDEGCDLTHEDITYKLPGYDAVTGTDNPSPQPRDGHGTSCAGVAAANANNGKGGVGVAPNCKVLPIRIAYGSNGSWVTTDAKIADGIRKAVDRGADVLSNSWGGGAPNTFITSAFKYAQTNGRGGKGCPIAVATSNEDVRGVTYPANLSPTIPGFLAVGASNEWDQRKSKTSQDGENWWGSNYGPEVDVVAPGVHIYTTDIMGTAGYGSGNYIPNFNGTSSATPHVAGLMGLILSVDPDLRSWEVEDIIKLTADDLGTPGRDEEFGFGRINCRRALEATSRILYEVNATPEFLGAGKECYMRLNVRVYNPGINSVRLDTLRITSHSADGTSEVDRFEYQPNPGGIMAPRSSQDVRFNHILLKANGNESNWNYRWALNWSYTFWRPNASGFPQVADTLLTESAGSKVTAKSVQGGANMPQRTGKSTELEGGNSLLNNPAAMTYGNESNGVTGDTITIDRQSKTITIVIR